MSFPDHFTCPISLDIFTDPVTLCTGQTYDRPYIEKWLAAGNATCPVTMQKLHDLSLVPNHTLRQLINQWLRTAAPSSPSSTQQALHYYFSRRTSSDPQRSGCSCFDRTMLAICGRSGFDADVLLPSSNQALEESEESGRSSEVLEPIRGRLSVDQYERGKHRCLVRSGFVPMALNLVFGREKLEDRYNESPRQVRLLLLEFIEEALCCAVKSLPFGSTELASLKIMLKEEEEEDDDDDEDSPSSSSRSNLGSKFKFLLRQGTPTTKVSLCTLILSVITSSSDETKELLFNTIVNNDAEIVKSIIDLLHNDDPKDADDEEVHESGIKLLSALLLLSSSKDSNTTDLETLIALDGVIDVLITYILRSSRGGRARKRNNDNASSQATKALEAILGTDKGKQSVIDNPNGIRALVKMVFKVSDEHQGSESAVSSLIILCCDSVQVRDEAIRRGVLTQLLLLIQSQCDVRTKTKARMLLKVLRSMCSMNIMKHV